MSTTATILDESIVTDLRAAVSGDVITADDAGYEKARQLWNGAVDRRPAVFVRVTSTDDVATAIAAARDHDLPLSVLGGGHHVTGSALVDDGLVVDMCEMNDVTIDPESRTARVGPGARVADVLTPAQEHGLSPVVGSAAQTGIAGSTLAGGIGWLRRKHGLGIDNLRSVELVTTDGTVLTASADENPGLFWAVRGSGAAVGVVTSFELELVEVGPEVSIAQLIYPVERAGDVLRAYRTHAAEAPDELTTLVALMRIPPIPMVPPEAIGAPVVMVYGVYAGPIEEGEQVVASLRDLGEPLMDMSGPQPLASVHEVARLLFPNARRYSWHSMYATDLADDDLDAVADALLAAPTNECELGIWHLGGAVSEVAPDATAYPHRNAEFLLNVSAGWDDPENDEACESWAYDTWDHLWASSSTIEGFYAGFPGFVDPDERLRMVYGDNYDRLASVVEEYDPENRLGSGLVVEPTP
ncbi:FAD-binding oxidoreductase [Halococcus hamelinensis]|uniref:FAD linked oxidase n=1 Tax=Halococcus hamelinensis 100A6 TaxID=1132509 RepID=M0LZS1_9EURY|nr:FAD-binding oxidoreductase [Halococcus hamelinensis]EMA39042.1 FAD linked oxidase [Halococcus hamelinensis 100A6]